MRAQPKIYSAHQCCLRRDVYLVVFCCLLGTGYKYYCTALTNANNKPQPRLFHASRSIGGYIAIVYCTSQYHIVLQQEQVSNHAEREQQECLLLVFGKGKEKLLSKRKFLFVFVVKPRNYPCFSQ